MEKLMHATVNGHSYTARVFDAGGPLPKVRIGRDGHWAGDGRLSMSGRIVDCPAVFGDERETEAVYLALEMSMPVEITTFHPERRF